jgi:NMD protein affecting ribosome stability and mRNA decay
MKKNNEKFCHECGVAINAKAEICPHCGVRQPAVIGVVSGIPGQRRCLSCGHIGPMKTWLRNYNGGQFMAIVLLLFWIIPGVVFIAWAWGKYKCPHCGKVGENTPA